MSAAIAKFLTENVYYKWVGDLGPFFPQDDVESIVADGIATAANWIQSTRWFQSAIRDDDNKEVGPMVHFQGPQGIARAKNNVIIGTGALVVIEIAHRTLEEGALKTLVSGFQTLALCGVGLFNQRARPRYLAQWFTKAPRAIICAKPSGSHALLSTTPPVIAT